MEREQAVCAHLHEMTKVPLVLADGTGKVLAHWPASAVVPVDASVHHMVQLDFVLQKRDEQHPLILYVEPGYVMGVARLSGELWLMTGLVSPVSHSREEIFSGLGKAVRPEMIRQFEATMFSSPLINLYQLKSLLVLAVLGCRNVLISESDVLFCDNTAARKWVAPLEQAMFDVREENAPHVPEHHEREVCTAITEGNEERLLRQLRRPSQGRVGKMSDNPLQQHKYGFVGFAVIVSRAAIQGGLEQETALNLSDLYCQRMDVMTDPALILRLMYSMAVDFCRQVHLCKGVAARSALVQKCTDYISAHLHEAVRLEQLAELTGYSTKTVADRFKKETGHSVADYIHVQKMQEARYLLRNTDYTLADIAEFLNYASQSYFTKIFRQFTGQTPQQYRDAPWERHAPDK